MESLNLSHVKATDRGIRLLLHAPLTHLTKLTLSHTRITSTTLTALPLGQYTCIHCILHVLHTHTNCSHNTYIHL